MKTALGCVGYLVVFAALAVALDRLTAPQVAAMWRPWLGAAAALLVTIGGSNLFQLLRGYGQGDRSHDALLARATIGEPPAEGGPMLVTGRARSDLPLLRAPLSGRECVAYQYRMYEQRGRTRRRLHTVVHWWGYACQPFVVDTHGRAIRVAAMPQINAIRLQATPDVAARARQHVGAAAFENVDGTLGIAMTMPAMLHDVVSQTSAGLRRDWHRESESADPESLLLEEAILPADTDVSVAGYWSPELAAIIPEPRGTAGSPVTATTGHARRLLRGDSIVPHAAGAVAIAGVLCLVLGGALVWAATAGYFAP